MATYCYVYLSINLVRSSLSISCFISKYFYISKQTLDSRSTFSCNNCCLLQILHWVSTNKAVQICVLFFVLSDCIFTLAFQEEVKYKPYFGKHPGFNWGIMSLMLHISHSHTGLILSFGHFCLIFLDFLLFLFCFSLISFKY